MQTLPSGTSLGTEPSAFELQGPSKHRVPDNQSLDELFTVWRYQNISGWELSLPPAAFPTPHSPGAPRPRHRGRAFSLPPRVSCCTNGFTCRGSGFTDRRDTFLLLPPPRQTLGLTLASATAPEPSDPWNSPSEAGRESDALGTPRARVPSLSQLPRGPAPWGT